MRAGANTVERVQILSHFLFEQKGFEGNAENYNDPRNSFLNDVLDRRLGLPITLSVVYLEVGRRSGSIFTASRSRTFPGQGGRRARRADYRPLQRRHDPGARRDPRAPEPNLRPAGRVASRDAEGGGARHILARMLRNLKIVYVAASDWMRALAALDRILMLEPRSLEELLERGRLYERLECFKPALDDYQSFLSQAPEHPAAEAAREAVMRLMRQVALIN